MVKFILSICLFYFVFGGIGICGDLSEKDPSLYRWGYWDKGVLPSAGPRYSFYNNKHVRYRNIIVYNKPNKTEPKHNPTPNVTCSHKPHIQPKYPPRIPVRRPLK